MGTTSCAYDWIGPTAGSTSGGISSSYVANVADFLKRAKANDLYTILDFTGVPYAGGYNVPTGDATHFGTNVLDTTQNGLLLTSEGVDVKKRFLTDFITSFGSSGAPLDDIFAFEIENEVAYDTSKLPLSLSSGMIATATVKRMISPVRQVDNK